MKEFNTIKGLEYIVTKEICDAISRGIIGGGSPDNLVHDTLKMFPKKRSVLMHHVLLTVLAAGDILTDDDGKAYWFQSAGGGFSWFDYKYTMNQLKHRKPVYVRVISATDDYSYVNVMNLKKGGE